MSQHQDICSITNGSAVVTVVGKDITAELAIGQGFSIPGDGVHYQIAGSIAFSTDTTFNLSANYSGDTAVGKQFVAWRDFSIDNFPLINQNDLDKPLIISNAINAINGKIRKGMITKTANFIITKNDLGKVFKVDATAGNITATIDPAADLLDGFHCKLKRIDASVNTVTIDPDGSETIDGATTKTMTVQWEELEIGCDGSNLFLIG